MSALAGPLAPPTDPAQRARLDEWVGRIGRLVADVRGWAQAADWPTRVVDKTLQDADLGGRYSLPALVIQRDTTRLMMEPVARQAPGADGVVDFYLMPGYDDVATLFHYAGGWHVHYPFRDGGTVATVGDGVAKPFGRDTFHELVEEMAGRAG